MLSCLETSYAFSRTFNSRNLEFYWCPLWCHTLFVLVENVPNLIVASQFPLWFVKQNDQLEGADDGDDPEEVDERAVQGEEDVAAGIQVTGADDGDGPEEVEERTVQGEEDAAAGIQVLSNNEEEGDHEPDLLEVGDISFASTVPEKNAESVLVDFTIVRLTAVPQPEKSRYGGWRITARSPCLLVEVKRFVSRSLKGDELDAEIRSHINEARGDLVVQAGHFFIQDKSEDSIMAIAAAGPYWSGTTIHRGDVGHIMDLISSSDPTYRPPGERLTKRKAKWNKILRLDGASSSVASEARLRTILKKMKEMENPKTDAK
ncbi:hypothetical protein BD769DRAFT_1776654 [Suillus cothurnatus]|nr:hypothetical protein BD769DRAFT_1776654 [Suillus cothurnatus]